METIAVTIATQVEEEGFCRPETVLFTKSSEGMDNFKMRIFHTLKSHRIVEDVREDKFEMDLSLYVLVVGSLSPEWMVDVRSFLKESFNSHSIQLTDDHVY